MKLHIIIPLLLLINFIFVGCSDSNNDADEDTFDLEWNKDMDIRENTMFYVDNDGLERTIDIEDMYVCLFPLESKHYIKQNVNNETFYFTWKDIMHEIEPGIVQLYSYGQHLPEDDFSTEYRGMLHIVEVSKGEWDKDLNEEPIHSERRITVKAIFHFKKDIYKKNDRITVFDSKETKGIFYYSGVEITGQFLEN